MRIDNRTSWSTADLRAVVVACLRERGMAEPDGAIVRVVYARSSRVSGWAWIDLRPDHPNASPRRNWTERERDGCAMLLRVPSPRVWARVHDRLVSVGRAEEAARLAAERPLALRLGLVCRHEIAHWQGLRHSQMAGVLLSCDGTAEQFPWLAGLDVRPEPEPEPVSIADRRAEQAARREAHARDMLARHERLLAQEERLVARWRTRVRYYDRKGRTVDAASTDDATDERREAAAPAQRTRKGGDR